MIAVEKLAQGEEDAWDAFLLGHQGGLAYHSTRYRDLIVDHLGCEAEYLVAREGGEIRGVLPIMWSGKDDGRVCNSLPFYGSHGGAIADGPEAEGALLRAWNERASDGRTLAATMVANPFLGHEPPAPLHGLTDERISQATPLPRGAREDDIMAMIRPEARRNVRKAERLGVSVQLDRTALSEVSSIHGENMRAIGGLAKSREFFEAIPAHLRSGEDFNVWIARVRREVVAALLVLQFNGVVEYFTPATRVEYRGHNPLASILLAAITHAANTGCRLWNWGGTWIDQKGVYRFKRKWGAQEKRYRYFTQLNDERLLEATPGQLQERFPHFYVAPFSALRSPAVATE